MPQSLGVLDLLENLVLILPYFNVSKVCSWTWQITHSLILTPFQPLQKSLFYFFVMKTALNLFQINKCSTCIPINKCSIQFIQMVSKLHNYMLSNYLVTVLRIIKLNKFPDPVRLRSGSGKIEILSLFHHVLRYLRTLYIVWSLVGRRVNRRLTGL